LRRRRKMSMKWKKTIDGKKEEEEEY